MKKILLFVLLLTISLNATIINECKVDLYYVNGIMTTKKEAKQALDNTLKPAILHDIYHDDAARMNKMHHFDVAYNYSFKDKEDEKVGKLGVIGGGLYSISKRV